MQTRQAAESSCLRNTVWYVGLLPRTKDDQQHTISMLWEHKQIPTNALNPATYYDSRLACIVVEEPCW